MRMEPALVEAQVGGCRTAGIHLGRQVPEPEIEERRGVVEQEIGA